jgi:anti-sigma factor RsiW
MTPLPIDDKLLVAFADGELDPATAQQVAARLAEDPGLGERVASFRRTGDLLRAALSDGAYAALPPPLAANARRLVLGAPTGRREKRYLAPLAAGIVGLMIGAGAMLATGHPPFAAVSAGDRMAQVLRDVGEYHAAFAAETDHLVEIPATGRDELEAWLGARVGLDFRIPDLTARRLAFAGGRMLVVDGKPVAQLMYTDPSGARIALCVTANRGIAAGQPRTIEADGIRLIGRSRGQHLYIVAGPAADAGLETLADDLPALLARS